MDEMRGQRAITAEREIVLTRVLDAPHEVVWKAWTDPKQMAQWWGPSCFTNPVCDLDVRTGGEIYIVMRSPDGYEYPMRGVFREIVPPERLVFLSAAEDKEGNRLLESLTTVTFAAQGDKTLLTVEAKAAGFVEAAVGMLGGMEAGWTQSLERLDELVAQTVSSV